MKTELNHIISYENIGYQSFEIFKLTQYDFNIQIYHTIHKHKNFNMAFSPKFYALLIDIHPSI